ncbi:uncharacterized protein LOC126397608 isoform X1 [Epinephelus moara]|uniref:uncharacterized protein LOC126397608 isoform X1 n=1 Tax=Epinephelus moara TaxID=300413 RepID=UPI00214EA5EA|nr:uncharacterized protein LOC126397608 isoform X1 [Epinephelus moara]
MEPQQPGRANRLFSWCEAFELITVSEEDSVHSSGPDSADSGDEADFIEGRDPSYDIVDDDDDEEEVGVSSPCIPEGGTGRGRGRGRRGGRRQSPSNRGSRVDDDDDEEEVGVSSPCIQEGGRGRGRRGGRRQSPSNRGSRVDDDDDEEEVGVSSPCIPEGGRGRGRGRGRRGGRSRSPVNRGSRSETLPDDAAGWRTEQEPDILPHPLPHFLPRRRPGVQPPLLQYVDNPSPSELFEMYFDRAAIKTLCSNTNRNAAKNIAAGKKFKWTELRESEMYQYIGITLYMGILKLPKLRDFWLGSSIF